MAVSLQSLLKNPETIHTFSGEDMPDDQLLRDCVHCGMCLPTCPTYRMTGQEASSPRGRLWLMKSVMDGRLDLFDPEFEEQMYQCLNCRACEAVCPSGVQYGPLVEASRAQLEEHRKRPLVQRVGRKLGMEWPFGEVKRFRAMVSTLRFYQRSGLAAFARKTGMLRLLRLETLEAMLPPIREKALVSGSEAWAPRHVEANVHLFNGCIMSTVFAGTNRAAGRVLAHNGCSCDVPEGQQCCGALQIHSGMMDEARRLARINIESFERFGTDPVIVTAAGCGAALKEYGHLLKDDPEFHDRAEAFSHRVKDVSEFLASRPVQPPRNKEAMTVTYQEPCHLAHAQRISEQPRELLRQVPGLKLVEMRESSFCCGSAGIYNVIRREMADDLGDRKAENVIATKADQVVTANPGCAMQLRTSLKRNGSSMPVRHVVDVLDEAYGGAKAATAGTWAIDRERTSAH
ncbi:MAG: (Fe-S)-binding protein [Thermomicrobiales bacterium]